MLKIKMIFVTILFLGIVLISCKKISEEKIPPVIILNGSNPASVLMGCSNYIDPGAFAKDDNSVPLIYVSGEVNSDSAGVYFLDYTAFDADSNMAFVSRKVIVSPIDFDNYLGDFSVADTMMAIPKIITKYPVTIDLFNTSPRTFRINNFNNFGENFKVLFQPDSSGYFIIDYNLEGIEIQGEGSTYCDNSGFRMTYTIETPGNTINYHKATYK